MKEKRDINGVKENSQNYTGKATGIIKKILALALSLGIVLSAAQAIRMYNEWKSSKTQDTSIENVEKGISFEDVKSLVQEYREAVKNNDNETIDKLEKKLHEGKYFDSLFGEFEKELIETLGYDPQNVDIVSARDGVFLVDKTKAAQRSAITSNGTINPWVKYIGENGKNPPIPTELKKMYTKLGEDMSFANIRGMEDLEAHFSNLESLEYYEIEEEDLSRE